MWHESPVRFLRLAPLFIALAAASCSSAEKKEQRTNAIANTRAIEQRRMQKVENGDVASQRGAEILVPNENKTFDPSQSGIGTLRPFGTGGARVKEYNFQQKIRSESFVTRDFSGSKGNRAADRKFAAGEANTRGKYVIPNTGKEAESKAATTKELWDGSKVAGTRDLHDGQRQYLGPESRKLDQSIDAKSLADWRSGASESVTYNGTTVDRVGTLKQLSIDDVRELLNKNK
jgi:hypothetical protein